MNKSKCPQCGSTHTKKNGKRKGIGKASKIGIKKRPHKENERSGRYRKKWAKRQPAL